MHLLLQEERCPVSDEVLGSIYRASSHNLDALLDAVPAKKRALLALYCHRRAHLRSVGLAVAARCEECDLDELGGEAGRALFDKARAVPEVERTSFYVARKQVSLSRGSIMQIVIDQDLI